MTFINWKMNLAGAILSLSAAGIANTALIGTALAEGRDPAEKAGYEAALRSAGEAAPHLGYRAQVIEGRNAYVQAPSTMNVEPYIQRSIEQNARSTR